MKTPRPFGLHASIPSEHTRLDRSAFEYEHEHERLMRSIRASRRQMWWHIAWVAFVWLPILVYILLVGLPFHGFFGVELALLVAQYGGSWAIGRYTR